jgi:anti-sigma regulatory factor (Ser/Thr protein kinase)
MKWTFESEDASRAHLARKDLVAYLALRASSEESDFAAAEAIFGELIGNVVRHAPGPVSVLLEWEDDGAVLRVTDRGPGFEWRGSAQPELLAEGGRGLFIVQALARALVVERLECGARASAWLPVQRERVPA